MFKTLYKKLLLFSLIATAACEKEPSIVVFDEAHNIDDICSECLSVELNEKKLDGVQENIEALRKELWRCRNEDANRY